MPFPDLSRAVLQVWQAFLNNVYWVIVLFIVGISLLKTVFDERRNWREFGIFALTVVIVSALLYQLGPIVDWMRGIAQGGSGAR